MDIIDELNKMMERNICSFGQCISVAPYSGVASYTTKAVITKFVSNSFKNGDIEREIQQGKQFTFMLPAGSPIPSWQDIITDPCGMKWSIVSIVNNYGNMYEVVAANDATRTIGNDRLDGR